MKNVNNLAELRAEIDKARLKRDLAYKDLSHRASLLNDPRTRGTLLRDAVGDALRAWKPFRWIHEVAHGRISGEAVAAAGMAAASMQGTWKKRLFWSGASWLLGQVVGDDPEKRSTLLDKVHQVLAGVRGAMKRPSKEVHDQEEVH